MDKSTTDEGCINKLSELNFIVNLYNLKNDLFNSRIKFKIEMKLWIKNLCLR